MKKRFLLSLILISVSTMAAAQQMDQAALTTLVEAERGFCKASVANGIRDAFIANLADDATLFRPHAVAGKKWMTEQPARPGLLTWEPIFADVSVTGDLGYTTGPWEFRKDGPADKEVAHGNYITIWKKQSGGVWKAVLDTGISNPPPTSKPAGLQTSAMRAKDAAKIDKVDVQSERAVLINRDREFSKSTAERGIVNAYDSYLSDDARVYRDNLFPLMGKRAAHEHLLALKGELTWQPAKADVSSAGDLGYTFGTAQLKGADAGKSDYSNYVRIWKKQAGLWKVVVDVMNSAPPPSATPPAAGGL
jgi:ketosteroid isomerase-like protein